MRSWRSDDIYWPIGRRNILLYDGPSRLNGARILVIATAQNGNRKIGHMLQLWIVPAISPIAAVRSGADAAVCGDCKLRGDGTGQQRACYTEYWRSVENIWQARGKTIAMAPQAFAARHPNLQLRIGAYGDPVAVPVHVWRQLLSTAAGFTAYTHAWRRPQALDYQDFCMASVDTPLEQAQAAAAGWRTFRVRTSNESLLGDEVACPASAEGGHRAVCAACELCQGARRGRVKHVAIVAHGRNAIHLTAARARTIPQCCPPDNGASPVSGWQHDQRVRAKMLRACAEEIENSLRNPIVSDRELLLNGIAWYRAQADSMDPPSSAPSEAPE